MTGSGKPRRRRLLQFSLRTLLVAMTVLAVWLGTWLDRGRCEKAAVDALSQKDFVGFGYDYQYDANGKRVNGASPPGPDWAREWIGKHCFAPVVALSGPCADLDGEALSRVARFRQLRQLRNDVMKVFSFGAVREWSFPGDYVAAGRVEYAPITDADLAHLSGLARLEELNLIGTNVTDNGLQHLTRLQRLKRLKISSPNITDEGISHFLKFRNLEDLCVSGTSISEAGVAKLRHGLPSCTIVGPADVPKPEEEDRLGVYSP